MIKSRFENPALVMPAVLAVYPFGFAIFVVFLFPDWQPGLGFIDDVTAGLEGCIPVWRRDTD